jgi:hypothetical protein
VKEESPVVQALATSFSVRSISGAAGAAALIGWAIGGWMARGLGSLLAAWTYLSVAALQVAPARALHVTVGNRRPEKR